MILSEGAFEVAEGHLLASGKRDSARLLAEMFIHWALPNQVYGLFALRGTIPYVTFLFVLNS
jgi:golgi to ER traffic protein 4